MRITSTQLKNLYKTTGKKPHNAVIQKDYPSDQPFIVDGRCVKFVFSSDAKDRDSDVVIPSGIDTTDFLRNPVILFAHDSSQLPVGKCVGLELVGNTLTGTIQIFDADIPEVGPKAEAILRILKQHGVMGVSIGFLPLEYDFSEDGGIIFTRSSLAEVSIVPVPANQEALMVEEQPAEEPNKDIEETEEESMEEPEEECIKPCKDTSAIRNRQLKALGII